MDLHVTGKRAIVVGGSRGIGLAVAKSLASEGVDVVIAARDPRTLEAAAESCGVRPGQMLPVQVDTTDEKSVTRMVQQGVGRLGGVDILVNAAADPARPGARSGFRDQSDDEYRREFETKVPGYLRCERAVTPHLIEQGWGRIISVSGLNARQTGSTLGSIRNVAVFAMTKNLADELGRFGINVTAVAPP